MKIVQKGPFFGVEEPKKSLRVLSQSGFHPRAQAGFKLVPKHSMVYLAASMDAMRRPVNARIAPYATSAPLGQY
jgi:hypothetical protein